MKTLQHIAAHFGFAIIPLSELKQMELDAASDYETYSKFPVGNQYLSGVADATAKRVAIFAEKYVPFSSHWKCRAPFQKPA